jgi:hypothetical protein
MEAEATSTISPYRLSPPFQMIRSEEKIKDHPTTLKGRVVIRHMDIAKGDDV